MVRTLLLLSLFVTGPAWAETLSVPANDPAVAAERPTRGSTMSTVQGRYGEPVTRHATVGQPPITRWDYPRFSVYFENDRVLHAVIVK
ncbi:MAG: hypothetical protein OEW16_12250 [Gammaproteobacteria bacterium]|nr:hypothetical protein [Gammaproteobacteria bacterium]